MRTRPIIKNSKKNSEKIQKIRKHHHSFFSSQNRTGKAEKERKKKIVLMYSYQNRNRKFQKNSKKIQKLESTIIASFPAKIGWETPRKREKKRNRFNVCLPDP